MPGHWGKGVLEADAAQRPLGVRRGSDDGRCVQEHRGACQVGRGMCGGGRCVQAGGPTGECRGALMGAGDSEAAACMQRGGKASGCVRGH